MQSRPDYFNIIVHSYILILSRAVFTPFLNDIENCFLELFDLPVFRKVWFRKALTIGFGIIHAQLIHTVIFIDIRVIHCILSSHALDIPQETYS